MIASRKRCAGRGGAAGAASAGVGGWAPGGRRCLRLGVAALVAFAAWLSVDIHVDGNAPESEIRFIASAEARIGRPLTPLSYAGVARRTTRRMIRRSTIYAATLPSGCVNVVIEGTALYRCGPTYYQPAGDRYVVVYVD